ncbi:MAG: hypothetical protein F4Y87_04735 [Synechococcus sp. SB0665_bin_28]|nr:hypothetical protein [Synechococcus sp. SB0665_bin_28]MYF20375.1 hypothetical protein [Synechococcus sp. SB0677_bin_5]
MLRKDFNLRIQGEQRLWSAGYFASGAEGASIETLKRYIQSQGQPDCRYPFRPQGQRSSLLWITVAASAQGGDPDSSG